MHISREKEAISAYLKLLQAKGAASSTLYKRSLFLDKLSVLLAGRSLDGIEYGRALDAVMQATTTDDWHINLNVAREFYPFWIKDIKAIAAFNLNYGFDVDAITWKPRPITLKILTDSLETEKFDTAETWPLKAYTQALYNEGAVKVVVETRIKFAKIILIRLRDAPKKNHKSYRTTVDMTLQLFNNIEIKTLFLTVVREFYHFWTGNPDAANKIFRDDSDNGFR
jgi:hypothetical protein